MKQNTLLIAGFLCFFMGAISIILVLVGLKLDILGFLYNIGSGFAFLVFLVLLFGGVCMIYISKNKSRLEAEEDEEVEA